MKKTAGEGILAAEAQLKSQVVATRMLASAELRRATGRHALVKLENGQHSGSFKYRGAMNFLMQLPADGRGVVAPSSGNHGFSVAMGAHALGREAVVLLPEDVAPMKRAAVLGEGAAVVHYDRHSDDREAIAGELACARDSYVVPSSDDLRIICGAGTVAREVLSEAPVVDALVVPVGGGGLLAGTCLAARLHQAPCEVFGVEPATADDAARSVAEGSRVRIAPPETVADGLRHCTPSALAFDLFKEQVGDILCVSDAEILEAVRFAAVTLGQVVEPSGAVALAALLSGRLPTRVRRPAIVVSGGNVDRLELQRLLAGCP